MYASMNNLVEVIDDLLPEVHLVDKNMITALMYAAIHKNIKIVNKLLMLGGK